MEKKSKLPWIIAGVIALVLAFTLFRSDGLKKELALEKQRSELDSARADSMRVSYNEKEKALEYSRLSYAADKGSLEKYLKEVDKKLYDLKKSNGSVAGAIVTNTVELDTAVKNSSVDSLSGKREAVIDDEFITAHITSYPDSTYLSIKKIQDSLKFSIGADYQLRVTHSNKLVKTSELSGFYVKPEPQKPKNWKLVVGAIAGLATGVFLIK